jgi:hypothetical protein
VKRHLTPGGLFYVNATESRDVEKTVLAVFPHALRVLNGLAASDVPLSLDPAAWEAHLEAYRIDGKPVLDLTSDEGRRALDGLLASMTEGRNLDGEPYLRRHAAEGEVITDDNMLPEWRELWHWQKP